MKEVSMTAYVREKKGTGVCRRLRMKGLIPAVIYGKKENLLVEIEEKKLEKVLRSAYGGNAIVNLHIKKDAKKRADRKVFIKEVQHHLLTGKILHVDFYQFTLDKEITTKVPVTLKGEAPGVTEQEGVLDHVLWELEIECLPAVIPERIEVDVSKLMIGDSIHVKGLSLSPEIKILTELEQAVVSVVAPKKLEVEEEKAPEEEITEPELIKKEKKPAEGEEAEEAKETKKEEKEPDKEKTS